MVVKRKTLVILDKTLVMMWKIVFFVSLAILKPWLVNCRRCNTCSCEFDWDTNTGTCNSPTFLSSCVSREVGNQICFVTSTYFDNIEHRIYQAISTNAYQDSHFIQAVETIALSNNAWLPSRISSISYGCDWDNCNEIQLALYLPESFNMTIDSSILNTELLNGQASAENCYSCSACINNLTAIICKQQSCPDGTCFIDEIHSYEIITEDKCKYNFFSDCQQLPNNIESSNVRIRATYYLDLPEQQQWEINEMQLKCTKDYCNSIHTVEYLKGQIQKTITLHPDFQPSRLNSTTNVPTTTTTTPESHSTKLYPIVYLTTFFLVLLL